VDSLIVDVTPKGLPVETALLAISFRPFCSSDHDEGPHYLPLLATWASEDIAQKKTWHKTNSGDFNYGIDRHWSNTHYAGSAGFWIYTKKELSSLDRARLACREQAFSESSRAESKMVLPQWARLRFVLTLGQGQSGASVRAFFICGAASPMIVEHRAMAAKDVNGAESAYMRRAEPVDRRRAGSNATS
jgi:hypothetical protein